MPTFSGGHREIACSLSKMVVSCHLYGVSADFVYQGDFTLMKFMPGSFRDSSSAPAGDTAFRENDRTGEIL
jgi:hypothetical protein